MVLDTARQRTLANALSVLIVAAVLQELVMVVGNPRSTVSLAQPLALVASAGSVVFSWAVLLGGVYAALTVERYDRPLLVVAPVVFGLMLAIGGSSVLSRGISISFAARVALGTALTQTAAVVALTLVVRAAFDIPAWSGRRASPSTAD